MALRLFNSRTRSVQTFSTRDPGHARIYVCGLTPSAQAHLGHARSFLFFDVLRRYLLHLGFKVTYVQNVTDIDDRSIAAALASGRSWKAVVEEYYRSFKHSMQLLGVAEPELEPRATEHIDDILVMIRGLLEAGHAYVAEDAVYFRVASFARYGELSGRNIDEMLVGARVAAGEYKDDPLDFALWKFAREGEPSWASPWGAGRPGWHIECSAMSQALLGLPLDIHGGGTDLIFPHHENEIAQTESLYPQHLANFWVHGGLLLFDGRKMSKSLGNFEPMSKLLERHDPLAIRLLFLQTGYRKPMNFTEDALLGATTGLKRLFETYEMLIAEEEPFRERTPQGGMRLAEFQRRFFDALDDDVNTSAALSVLFDITAECRSLLETDTRQGLCEFFRQGMELLGLSPNNRRIDKPRLAADFLPRLCSSLGELGESELGMRLVHLSPEEAIAQTLEARTSARAARDFARSDRFRDVLAALGVTVKDDRSGSLWSLQ